MSAPEAARRLADQFDEAGIPYAIGGALALGVWGAPRNTIDVDISAFVAESELPRVLDVRRWIEKMVPAGDRRLAALESLADQT